MPEKKITIPLSKALLLPDGTGVNKNYINIVLEEEIPVFCINRSTKKDRLMPFKVLYDNNENFWQQEGSWAYFFTGEDFEKLKEKAAAKAGGFNYDRPKTEKIPSGQNKIEKEEEIEELEVEVGFGSDYNIYAKMTTEEKIECLTNNKTRLTDLITQKTKDSKVVTEALVDTAKDAAMINHAALEEAMYLADDEAKKFTKGFVDVTHEMVKASTQLFSETVMSDKLMNDLVKKSNGTIVQHMTRVYLNGIAFLTYYNNLVSTSSAIQRLRISFASKYRKYYSTLLPHINSDDVDLERVFFGGMRAVAPDLLYKWAVGFLIHDIGKASAVEYHEGEAKYDRLTVIDHVRQGYKSIMSKTSYPMEASLITGYHHEYYGNSEGYGYFRTYLQQYKKHNPDAKQDYCITYELEPILDYRALAYFPAKVLEIIDVYDSVTDPNRIYRKAMAPQEAITMMREQFVENHIKIDPILFDIFSTYVQKKQDAALSSAI
jgi:hypothetical protein